MSLVPRFDLARILKTNTVWNLLYMLKSIFNFQESEIPLVLLLSYT